MKKVILTAAFSLVVISVSAQQSSPLEKPQDPTSNKPSAAQDVVANVAGQPAVQYVEGQPRVQPVEGQPAVQYVEGQTTPIKPFVEPLKEGKK